MVQRMNSPEIGTRVRVRIGNFSYGWMNRNPSRVIEGMVAPNYSWQDSDSFRLQPLFTPGIGESIITMSRVISIEEVVGSNIVEAQRPNSNNTKLEAKTWTVPGSKGQSYTVARNNDLWSCTCIAGGFGRSCKHVNQIKESIQG